jgi:quercetin dioxygenase-like cupin family protein
MKVISYSDIETYELTPGVHRRVLISEDDGAKGVLAIAWELEPDCKSHSHSHEYEHGALILSGEGLLLSGEKQTPIKKNDVIFINANMHHCFYNNSSKKLSYVLFSQPHIRDKT